MILLLVFAGFLAGSSAAVLALAGGGGVLVALAAYAVFGVSAVIVTAVLLALGPIRRGRTDARPRAYPEVNRHTSPATLFHAPGASSTPSTRSGLVGGGMITSGSTLKPKRA